MLDEKDLQAIQKLIEASEQRTGARLDKIEEALAEVREHAEVTRGATNYLVEWVERIEKKVDDIA